MLLVKHHTYDLVFQNRFKIEIYLEILLGPVLDVLRNVSDRRLVIAAD